jgi:hypothetical protein
MTGQSAPLRKPYDATPYAALRETDSVAAKGSPAAAAGAVAHHFQAEIDKLEGLRAALWSAFEAGPEAGLPNTLIDLTMAYTSALRLQLTLKASAVRAPRPKPAPAAAPPTAEARTGR